MKIIIQPIHCAHIAAFYQHRWEREKNLYNTLLWRGYHQCAAGELEEGNNLFEPALNEAKAILEHERLHELYREMRR